MLLDDETRGQRLFGSDQTTGLFVSLYLILLAFFMVLGATSQRAADRAQAAIDSVNATFTGQSGLATDSKGLEDFRQRAGQDSVIQMLVENFYSQFEIQGKFTTDGNGTVEFDLPVDYVFADGSVQLTPRARFFLSQIARGSRTDLQGRRLQAAFLMADPTVDKLLPSRAVRTQRRRVRQLGRIAYFMQQAGFRDADLSIGFFPIDADIVRFSVRVTAKTDASITLRQLRVE